MSPRTAYRPSTMHVAAKPETERCPWLEDATKLSLQHCQSLCELVAHTTAAAFAVPVGELASASRRSAYTAFVRQSAMYLAHVSCGLSFTDVGRAFGRDRTTAAHACRLVEDRRDEPEIDAVLASLENACIRLRHSLTEPVQR